MVTQGGSALQGKGIDDLDTLMDNVPGISDDIKRGIKKLFGGS